MDRACRPHYARIFSEMNKKNIVLNPEGRPERRREDNIKMVIN